MTGRIFAILTALCLVASAATARQVALIVGNSAYSNAPALDNPENDATAIDATLRSLGFETQLLIDADLPRFAEALATFETRLEGAEAAVFFFAGHGMQLGGQNYLLGIEAKVANQFALDGEAIRLDRVLDLMEERALLSMAFIDACRDNPLAKALEEKAGGRARSLGLSRGLAPLSRNYRDTLVAYATAPGAVALDGITANSPFTAALLRHIETPGIEVSTMLKRVTGEVLAATDGAQQPEVVTQMSREFYFKGTVTVEGTITAAPDARTPEALARAALETAQRIGDPVSRARALMIVARQHSDTTAGTLAGFLAQDLNRQFETAKSQANAAARDANTAGDRADFSSLLNAPAPAIEGEVASITPEQFEKSLGLSATEYRDIQRTLNALGYWVGSEDGRFGTRSRAALKAFQAAQYLEETGYISEASAKRLAREFNAAPASLDGTYQITFRRRWDDAWHKTHPDPYYAPGRVEALASIVVERAGTELKLVSVTNMARVETEAFEDFRGVLGDDGRFRMSSAFNYLFGKRAIIRLNLDAKWPQRFAVNRTYEFEQGMYDPAFHGNFLIRRIR